MNAFSQWQQGRAEIDQLLAESRLERVPASRDHADDLIAQARRHVVSGRQIAGTDPQAGYAVIYDAARKAMTAVLENQGLRATTKGGHVVVGDAVIAQLDPPQGKVLRPFHRLRSRRNTVEYPSASEPRPTAQDVLDDATKAEQIVEVCAQVLDHMPAY